MGDTKVKFKDIVKAAKKLNEANVLDKKLRTVGIKAEVLSKNFIDAVDKIDNHEGLDDEIKEMYEHLGGNEEIKLEPDVKVKNTDEEKAVHEAQGDPCEEFGTGFDMDDDLCKDCKKDFPKDYKKCEAMMTEVDSGEDKEEEKEERSEKKKATKEKTIKKTEKKESNKTTKISLFIEAITKKPKTMKEIKEMSWNDKSQTMYNVFNKLVADGKAFKTEDGKMSIK